MALFSKRLLESVETQPSSSSQRYTILIVDDEEHNLATLSDLLGDEYNVLTAVDGTHALEVIKKQEDPQNIHLILSDQRMPGMSGTDFLGKTIPLLPKTPRIILTGFSDTDVLIDSINLAQIYRFVMKPFNQEDLLLTIRRALESYQLEIDKLSLVEELKEANMTLEDKVKERTQQLENTLDRLKELNAMKDKFFSLIAHDTSNIFSSLFLAGQMLNEQIRNLGSEKVQMLSEKMLTSSKRLYLLMENLLEWSKMQTGKLECYPEVFEFKPLTGTVFDLLSDTAFQKKIQLINEIPPTTVVYADYNMVHTVMRNLISNAIKFTHQDGEIRVFSKENEAGVEIFVKDNGIGIDKEMLPNLFRIDSKTTSLGTADEKGNGLGLLLCKEMIEKNFGKIAVESAKNQGTVFSFTLPKTEEN